MRGLSNVMEVYCMIVLYTSSYILLYFLFHLAVLLKQEFPRKLNSTILCVAHYPYESYP